MVWSVSKMLLNDLTTLIDEIITDYKDVIEDFEDRDEMNCTLSIKIKKVDEIIKELNYSINKEVH